MSRLQRHILYGLVAALLLALLAFVGGRHPLAGLLLAIVLSAGLAHLLAYPIGRGRAPATGMRAFSGVAVAALYLALALLSFRESLWAFLPSMFFATAGGFLSGLLRGRGRLARKRRRTGSPSAAAVDDPTAVVDSFHRLYYESNAFTRTSWLGVSALKCPLDLWIYQEIIHDLKPDLIIECGTASGGSALFLASICDLVGNGRVITIDIEDKPGRPQHPRITYLHGSSISPAILEQVKSAVAEEDRALVLLDSDHRKDHVLAELRAYSSFVTSGSYLIVEDTNIGGHPVAPEAGPGPMEAVDAFLAENSAFVIDEGKEKFFLTFNPRGYLKRIK